jgi:MFS family permease
MRFMPSATGIVSDHFGPERDRAVGMFTSIQARVFGVFAVLIAALLPLVALVPDHRGNW